VSDLQPLKTGVLLSGGGTTLQNLLDLAGNGELPLDIRVVIGTKSGAYGQQRAELAGIDNHLVPRRDFSSAQEFSRAVAECLAPHALDLVLMAGLIHLFYIPDAMQNKVMNIHPALIPSFSGRGFYDRHVHDAVIASGVKFSGCTVHFADNRYDTGPIILQKIVPVTFDDTPETLREKVQAAEREAYPEAIRLFAAGKLETAGRRVRILP